MSLARLAEQIELSIQSIADEFGDWEVRPVAVWLVGRRCNVVFRSSQGSACKYFGYSFWRLVHAFPPEDVEYDLAGELTWYYMAGDYPATGSLSDGTYIDWRASANDALPRTIQELAAIAKEADIFLP